MNEIVYFSVWAAEKAHPMAAEKLQRLISPFTRKAKSGEVLRALDKSVLQLFLYVSTCRVDFWGILGNSLGAFSGRCGRPSGHNGQVVSRGRCVKWKYGGEADSGIGNQHIFLCSLRSYHPVDYYWPVVNFCLLAGSELLGWSVYGFVWRVGLE